MTGGEKKDAVFVGEACDEPENLDWIRDTKIIADNEDAGYDLISTGVCVTSRQETTGAESAF